MKIRLIAVGTKMPVWISAGYQEYSKRLPRELQLELVEIAPGNRSKGADPVKAMAKESKDILQAIGKNDYRVALDIEGKMLGTPALAEKLTDWQMLGTDVALLVGGPDGLARECLQGVAERWSLSRLTFPHPLVRVLVAEQIYRAWTLTKNHPYHR